MNNFSIRSLFLGMGIGIIITSIAGMIYFAGLDPLRNLSEKDIKKLESRYGLEKVQTVIEETSPESAQ